MRGLKSGLAIVGLAGLAGLALWGCGADAPGQGDHALTAEECEAQGGQLFLANPYDAARGCYEEPAEPAFCQPDPDILCGWEGDPILLTEPDGTTWYIGWSCFTTPEGWDREYVPGGKPGCGA